MEAHARVRRWFAFNGVGIIGFVLQLGVLAALVRWTPLHYLAATAIAVECAVLHNFAWHQAWTWRDRRVTSPGDVVQRLARFHLTNGVISLAGNVALVGLLTGILHVNPVIANAAAVLVCSMVNFAVSDVLVFRHAAVLLAIAGVGVLPITAYAATGEEVGTATLDAATIAAWNAYERRVDARYYAAGPSLRPFFAADAFAAPSTWPASAFSGRVPMLQVSRPSPGDDEPDIPSGRVHHWIGAVFVPGVTLDRVLRTLQDRAGRESEAYEDVLASRLMWREGERLGVYMKLRRDSVITVTYNTEHTVAYRRLGASRATSRSVATRIAELADAGTPREREKPLGADRGFLWRLDAYWRYEETNGGVLIECESVSLSRSVPLLVRPFVTRAVEGIARDALEKTLLNLRRVLGSRPT